MLLGIYVWYCVVLLLCVGRQVRRGGTLTRRWSRKGRRRRRRLVEGEQTAKGGMVPALHAVGAK